MSQKPVSRYVDFSKLDKTIHEKARLSIMTLLAAKAEWSFQDLKSELDMSDGNLITHLRALYNSGYVSMTKDVEKRPQTKYALTGVGRLAFEEYLEIIEQILRMSKS
ncbi:MAG: transcriptional regulator [Verrucomicrobiales bacterium]|nr:transcriptional regulator [Verrucomicrobiae bacterium]